MHFTKYHALGNDYIVLPPPDAKAVLTPEQVRRICHRNYGIGSDGVLFGPISAPECDFALRIFNPDGSEAEKSGNGLRIFSRYLWDKGLVSFKPFTILTPGGLVTAQVHPGGRIVTVEMGKVSFDSARIPVAGPPREAVNETLEIGGRRLTYCAATIGNPHCVVLFDEPTETSARRFGPLIEKDERFPNRTNVQFMKVLDRHAIQIEIWERGAGYTLASGSSSSAAAAVACRLGLCDSPVLVHMPGGTLDITVSGDLAISMKGPVARICEGDLDAELFQE